MKERLSAVSRKKSEMKEKLEKRLQKIYLWKTSINKLKLSCKFFFFYLRGRRDEKNSDRLRNLK